MDRGAEVSLQINDITGKLIVTMDQGYRTAGEHLVEIHSTHLEPGMYFYTLKAGSHQDTKTMIITH